MCAVPYRITPIYILSVWSSQLGPKRQGPGSEHLAFVYCVRGWLAAGDVPCASLSEALVFAVLLKSLCHCGFAE